MQRAECRVNDNFRPERKFPFYYICKKMKKTGKGGFPPLLCTLNSALCTQRQTPIYYLHFIYCTTHMCGKSTAMWRQVRIFTFCRLPSDTKNGCRGGGDLLDFGRTIPTMRHFLRLTRFAYFDNMVLSNIIKGKET